MTKDYRCTDSLIAGMNGSVLASRNDLGKKARNYRHKKRKTDEDDSSDVESNKPSTAVKEEKATEKIATAVDQSMETTCEKTR